MSKKTYVLCLLMVVSHMTFADDNAPQRTNLGQISIENGKKYRFEGDFGYLFNQSKSEGSKNSTKENLTVHFLFQRQAKTWGQEVIADIVSTNDDTSKNNIERYFGSAKLLYRSSESVYQFGKLTAEKDLSSAYDYQLTTTAGLGKDLFKLGRQSLTTELGTGLGYSKQANTPEDHVTEVLGSIALFYIYQINPFVRFNQDLGYQLGVDTQTLRSRTALSADLNRHFSAAASYSIKNLHAEAGDSRDSLLSLGLRYRY